MAKIKETEDQNPEMLDPTLPMMQLSRFFFFLIFWYFDILIIQAMVDSKGLSPCLKNSLLIPYGKKRNNNKKKHDEVDRLTFQLIC